MDRIILHVDFNSYFATIEQQANPRLRGKPIGVTGGDRLERTVIGAASVEAKVFGVRTGMNLYEAKKICPQLVLVRGDSDKYLECTKRFLTILRRFSPFIEVFSIDEVFLELPANYKSYDKAFVMAQKIKQDISKEVGEWVKCSIGISYNKVIAKLAGSLYKPNGLVVIEDEIAAQKILDASDLDDICGIGRRLKSRLNNMGIFNFKALREVPIEDLKASFKDYFSKFLFDLARGVNDAPIVPFYEKAEVKSVGHRHTLSFDTKDETVVKQTLIKLTELISRKLREKKLVGKTVTCWYRNAFNMNYFLETGHKFYGDGMQISIPKTADGLEIFKTAWKIFLQMWGGEEIRMVGASVSNLSSVIPENLTFLEDINRQELILKALDKINNKYGEFTLQRGILVGSAKVSRKPNPFLADYRFKL